jgi:signal recognition particle GTPase
MLLNPDSCSTENQNVVRLQVSVVDELGIPVKFVGVGEGLEDLQPFDANTYVEALFPKI